MTTAPSPKLQHATAVLDISGAYLLMSMEDVIAMLPLLSRSRAVERDWSTDSFKAPARRAQRAFTVTPVDEGELAAILMRSSAT